jgi:hypothetical protein
MSVLFTIAALCAAEQSAIIAKNHFLSSPDQTRKDIALISVLIESDLCALSF